MFRLPAIFFAALIPLFGTGCSLLRAPGTSDAENSEEFPLSPAVETAINAEEEIPVGTFAGKTSPPPSPPAPALPLEPESLSPAGFLQEISAIQPAPALGQLREVSAIQPPASSGKQLQEVTSIQPIPLGEMPQWSNESSEESLSWPGSPEQDTGQIALFPLPEQTADWGLVGTPDEVHFETVQRPAEEIAFSEDGAIRAVPIGMAATDRHALAAAEALLFAQAGDEIPEALTEESDAERGERLARTYCAACHLTPIPELLDRKTWLESVLPAMKPGGSPYTQMAGTETGMNQLSMARPKAPQVSPEDWEAIVTYYRENAPEALAAPDVPVPIEFDLPGFEVVVPDGEELALPMTTALRVDPQRNQILVGFSMPDRFLVYDDQLEIVQEARLSSAPTWFEPVQFRGEPGRRLAITLAGQLDPNDLAEGNLIMVQESDDPATPWVSPRTILQGLRRPVNTQFADLNRDGAPDPIIAQYGDTIGKLSWYASGPMNSLQEQPILPHPGSIMTKVVDYDGDGDADIMALIGQERDGLYLFLNDGIGNFEMVPLLRMAPVFGVSSFELVDLTGDGRLDLIVTCGDNADLSPILKPYHGVHIFVNEGEEGFLPAWFYPMNGAYGCRAADFDGDGDIDLAAISMFPDYQNRPHETFLYFENGGESPFDYQPYTFEGALGSRFLTMDVGDADGDGDLDIVVGNFLRDLMNPGGIPDDLKEKWSEESNPPFILLRNTSQSAQP